MEVPSNLSLHIRLTFSPISPDVVAAPFLAHPLMQASQGCWWTTISPASVILFEMAFFVLLKGTSSNHPIIHGLLHSLSFWACSHRLIFTKWPKSAPHPASPQAFASAPHRPRASTRHLQALVKITLGISNLDELLEKKRTYGEHWWKKLLVDLPFRCQMTHPPLLALFCWRSECSWFCSQWTCTKRAAKAFVVLGGWSSVFVSFLSRSCVIFGCASNLLMILFMGMFSWGFWVVDTT